MYSITSFFWVNSVWLLFGDKINGSYWNMKIEFHFVVKDTKHIKGFLCRNVIHFFVYFRKFSKLNELRGYKQLSIYFYRVFFKIKT